MEPREENKEEQQPTLKWEGPQAAVLREILEKFNPPSQAGDLASITLLETSGYDSDSIIFCKFHKYGHVYISDQSLSDATMDRFVAAWIKWRADHYQPPLAEKDGLDEIKDHPF